MIKIIQGDCIEVMKRIKPDSIDAVITDPPYGLTSITNRFGKEGSAPAKYGKDGSFARLSGGFMGKKWDGSGIEYNVDMWREVLRVLKPGGYLLSFGGTRTYHRMACAIEDAGFDIRDIIMWIYGEGFPKGHNISKGIDKKLGVEPIGKKPAYGTIASRELIEQRGWNNVNNALIMPPTQTEEAKQWEGWNTNLKPAFEPILCARKKFKGTVVDNILKHGVGGINVGACKIGTDKIVSGGGRKSNMAGDFRDEKGAGMFAGGKPSLNTIHQGRYPSNVILDESSAKLLDKQSGITKSTGGKNAKRNNDYMGLTKGYTESDHIGGLGDKGGSSRFFYIAKSSKSERNKGLNALPPKQRDPVRSHGQAGTDNPYNRGATEVTNFHPTCKPLKLMEYLVKLVTPPDGIVLDPFLGSGTTAIACKKLHKGCIGIEMNQEYCDIANARLKATLVPRSLYDL